MFKFAFDPNRDWLSRNDYSIEEEAEIYDETLQDVLNNTRWYLDNLDYLPEYKVRWKDYRHKCPTVPFRFVHEDK